MTDRPYPGNDPLQPGAQPPPMPPQPGPGVGQPSPYTPGPQQPPYQAAAGPAQFPGAPQQPFPAAPGTPGGPGGPAGPGARPNLPGQPGGPAGYPPAPAQGAPAPKKKTGLIIGIVAGVLALLLIIVVVATRSGGGGGGGILGMSGTEKATQLATDYYTALSEGRAADALAMINPNFLDDTTLLTDEVLADSMTRAALTDFTLSEPVSESSDVFLVPVTYTLGGTQVSDELRISTWDDEPTIDSTLSALTLSEGLPVTVNGVSASGSSLSVFPGSYEVAPESEYLVYEGGPLLIEANGEYLGAYDLTLSVTEAGVTMFREKVTAEVTACLASKALDPGCGAALPSTLSDGTPIRDGSVTRSQDAESRAKLAGITPTPGSSAPNVISVYGSDLGSIDLVAECQDSGGGWAPCELWGYGDGFSFGDPSINLDNPDLAVEWD